jgi:hypothetical protein
MQWRWFGALLLILSLIILIIAVSNVKTTRQIEVFARNAEDGTNIEDTIVKVPPWNASQEKHPRGWVGFNVSMRNAGKEEYEANGVMVPADLNQTPPTVVMRVVNLTGLAILRFAGFDAPTFTEIKNYAGTFLNSSHQYSFFRFVGLDNSSKYVVLFRDLINGTQDSRILISIKESWIEERNLMEPSTSNVVAITTTGTALAGLFIVIRNPGSQKKAHRLMKQRRGKFHQISQCRSHL